MCPGGTGYPCRCGALRGAQGGGRLLILPLAFLFAPYPPSPLPRWGRGRPKVYFAGGFAPGTPALDRSRHLQPLPSGHPGGRTRAALAIPAAVVPGGGLALFAVRLPCLYLLFCPLSPRPRSQSALPQRGRGSPKVYFAGGFAPGTPALDRSRHLQTFPNRSPAQRGVRGWSPEWQEMLFFGQCRQPRRGGTGGDGTIRRK